MPVTVIYWLPADIVNGRLSPRRLCRALDGQYRLSYGWRMIFSVITDGLARSSIGFRFSELAI